MHAFCQHSKSMRSKHEAGPEDAAHAVAPIPIGGARTHQALREQAAPQGNHRNGGARFRQCLSSPRSRRLLAGFRLRLCARPPADEHPTKQANPRVRVYDFNCREQELFLAIKVANRQIKSRTGTTVDRDFASRRPKSRTGTLVRRQLPGSDLRSSLRHLESVPLTTLRRGDPRPA